MDVSWCNPSGFLKFDHIVTITNLVVKRLTDGLTALSPSVSGHGVCDMVARDIQPYHCGYISFRKRYSFHRVERLNSQEDGDDAPQHCFGAYVDHGLQPTGRISLFLRGISAMKERQFSKLYSLSQVIWISRANEQVELIVHFYHACWVPDFGRTDDAQRGTINIYYMHVSQIRSLFPRRR